MSEEKRGYFYSAKMLIGTNTSCDRCKEIKERVLHLKYKGERADGMISFEDKDLGYVCTSCWNGGKKDE